LQTLNINERIIGYSDTGQGEVIVLLHGYGADSFIWIDTAKILSHKYRVICIDLPGYGDSTLVIHDDVSLYDYTDAVHQVISYLGIDTFSIGGHSMGGYTAMHYTERYPNKIKGLMLINTHCYEDPIEKKSNRHKSITFIKKHGTALFLAEFYTNLFTETFKKSNYKLLETLQNRGLQIKAETFIQGAQAMINRTDKSHVLVSHKYPVLIIAGALDTAIPLSYTLQMTHLNKQTEFHLINTVNHMAMYEWSDNLSKIISEYIQNICA
jgi:pimeloyl-ACP methyl ester carboxylesterase